MAILAWPDTHGKSSICMLCGKPLSFQDATIVCEYLDSRPALACETHRTHKVRWVEACMAFEWGRQTIDLSAVPLGCKNVNLYIESRNVDESANLKSDLGWHLLTRSAVGKCVIVTNHPIELLSTLRKQWKKMTKQLHIERARTLHASKVIAFDTALKRLHSLSFSGTISCMEADVLVLSPEDLPKIRCDIATMYICDPLTEMQLVSAAKVLQQGGVIVDYSQTPDSFLKVNI